MYTLVFVLVPYKITLLSNRESEGIESQDVLVPYKITLLSNGERTVNILIGVLVPYKITLLSNVPVLYHFQRLSFSTL